MESIQTPLRSSTFNSAQEPFTSSFTVVWTREPTTIVISITHPLSAPLRATPAEVRNPLRHPLTLPTALPLHSALSLPTRPLHPLHASRPPNTNSPSRTKRASPAHTSSIQKEKKERSPASQKQLDTAAAKSAIFVRRTLFPLPLSASRADLSIVQKREREIM